MKKNKYVKNELLPKMQRQYLDRNREGKTTLIDTVFDVHGYSRKYAIKLLRSKTNPVGNPKLPKGYPIREVEDVVKMLKWILKAILVEKPYCNTYFVLAIL